MMSDDDPEVRTVTETELRRFVASGLSAQAAADAVRPQIEARLAAAKAEATSVDPEQCRCGHARGVHARGTAGCTAPACGCMILRPKNITAPDEMDLGVPCQLGTECLLPATALVRMHDGRLTIATNDVARAALAGDTGAQRFATCRGHAEMHLSLYLVSR